MKLFYCYSPKLKSFLKSNDVHYLHYGVHYKTKKKFWVYKGDKSLNQYLDLWNHGKD